MQLFKDSLEEEIWEHITQKSMIYGKINKFFFVEYRTSA